MPGLINGLLISRLKAPSFIVTMGIGGIARGLALVISGGMMIGNLPPLVGSIGNSGVAYLLESGELVFQRPAEMAKALQLWPFSIWPCLILLLVTYFILSQTRFGRHVYAIALDLGMPTGVLAKLGESISEQNSLMLSMLLAPYGGIKIGHDDVVKLPAYMALGSIPVMHAMPPYGLWEEPAVQGRIPPHRTDSGVFLTAEVVGAKKCILVKDERGLFTADPKKDPKADFIPEIEVNELLELDLADLAVERAMLQALSRARNVHEVFIINGREPGNLARTLNGENPGTRIYRKL